MVIIIFLAIGILGYGFHILGPNERGIVLTLGKPKRMVKPGLTYIFWPFQKIIRFTTELVEIKLPDTVVITAEKKISAKEAYGPAKLTIKASFFFRWPKEGPTAEADLITALDVIGDPNNTKNLTDLFEEPIREAIRTVAGKKSWRELTQEEKILAKEIAGQLGDEPDKDPTKIARIEDNFKVVIHEIVLPKELEDALLTPEITRINNIATVSKATADAKATGITAEATKKKTITETEGIAKARKELFEAIGKEPEDIQKEILLSLREMAQGPSNTILYQLPPELTEFLAKYPSIAGKAKKVFSKGKGTTA